MFNYMLDTLEQPLSQKANQTFHFELKSGVFADRANGSAIGDYKKRRNIIGIYESVYPEDIPLKMQELLQWHHSCDIIISCPGLNFMRVFIPFKMEMDERDGLFLFRGCLINRLVPLIIMDETRMEYLDALASYCKGQGIDKLTLLFRKEQKIL